MRGKNGREREKNSREGGMVEREREREMVEREGDGREREMVERERW